MDPRADALRELLCKAAAVAHRENGARFDPEDLGDEALMYGLGTTINARHLAGRAIEDADLDGVAVCEHGKVWWLEIQREDGTAVRAYFYKAPPGARTVHDLRLDDTEIKKELSTSNGQQMALFNRSGEEGNAELLNILVVHYGDPVTGLEKLDVGAPYVNGDEIAWDWYERFDSDAASRGRHSVEPVLRRWATTAPATTGCVWCRKRSSPPAMTTGPPPRPSRSQPPQNSRRWACAMTSRRATRTRGPVRSRVEARRPFGGRALRPQKADPGPPDAGDHARRAGASRRSQRRIDQPIRVGGDAATPGYPRPTRPRAPMSRSSS